MLTIIDNDGMSWPYPSASEAYKYGWSGIEDPRYEAAGTPEACDAVRKEVERFIFEQNTVPVLHQVAKVVHHTLRRYDEENQLNGAAASPVIGASCDDEGVVVLWFRGKS